MVKPGPQQRRSLVEHVRASGEFPVSPWSIHRALARHRSMRRAGAPNGCPRATFSNDEAYLSRWRRDPGIDAAHLRTVFLAPHPPTNEQFANSIATLSQLRNAL